MFVGEIFVQRDARQPGASGNLSQGDVVDARANEELLRRFEDALALVIPVVLVGFSRLESRNPSEIFT